MKHENVSLLFSYFMNLQWYEIFLYRRKYMLTKKSESQISNNLPQGSLSSLTANINNIKAELQENLKNVKTDFQVIDGAGQSDC